MFRYDQFRPYSNTVTKVFPHSNSLFTSTCFENNPLFLLLSTNIFDLFCCDRLSINIHSRQSIEIKIIVFANADNNATTNGLLIGGICGVRNTSERLLSNHNFSIQTFTIVIS